MRAFSKAASGYEKGYFEGEQRAKAIVEQLASDQLAAQKASLSSLISEIVNPLAKQSHALKQTLTELVEEISQKVCERELLLDNSSIASVVGLAIDALPVTETDLTLFLHPKDLATLESITGLFSQSGSYAREITWSLATVLLKVKIA